MNVELHIEHLVLDGLPVGPEQGAAIHAAVAAELPRLLGGGERIHDLQRDRAVARLRGPDIGLPAGHTPDDIGRHLARSLHEGLINELA